MPDSPKPPTTIARSGKVLCRREVLGGLAAMLAAPCLLPSFARAALPPFRGRIGSFEISIVSDGTLNIPLPLLLPETPDADAAKLFASLGLPPDGLPLQTNVALVNAGSEVVLIDAGSGSRFQPTAGQLSANLEAAGVDPKSITKVVFTHGHPDHLWGVLDNADAERFPNARYVISAAEWEFWTHPDTPSRAPDWMRDMASGSARVLKLIEKKIERRGSGHTIAPGMTYVATPGHTPGHMAVGIESNGQRLLISGDVLSDNIISFAKPEWRIGTDVDRDQAVITRTQLLDQLASERMPLIGFHLSWPGFGMVERRGAAYRFVPV